MRIRDLREDNNLTQEDVDMADSTSPINDGVESVLNDMRENIDNHLYDTKTEDEIENYY